MSDIQTPVSYLPPPPMEPPAPPAPRRRPGMVVGAIVLVLALVAGATVFALTRGEGSAAAQPLALAFTEGDSTSYAIHMTMDGTVSSDLLGDLPMKMDMSEVVTWKVTNVDQDGVATVQVTIDEMSGSVDGTSIPSTATDLPPIEIKIAPDGRILSAAGFALGGAEQTQGFGFPGMGQLTPILPDGGEAVAPGDTWSKHFSQDFPFGHGTIEYTAESTYDRNETVNGRDAAVIVTHMTVPMDFTVEMKDLLDAASGSGFDASGLTGADALANASIGYRGTGTITQTSYVDLAAKELLKSDSSGDFDISMNIAGIPGFDGAITFNGTFTQSLEVR